MKNKVSEALVNIGAQINPADYCSKAQVLVNSTNITLLTLNLILSSVPLHLFWSLVEHCRMKWKMVKLCKPELNIHLLAIRSHVLMAF